MTDSFEQAADKLAAAGRQLFTWGMVPATSGNFSMRLDAQRIAITVSGAHKGFLGRENIMLVNYEGQALDNRRPSAETLLHTQIYKRYPQVMAVLHPHSVNATLLSKFHQDSLVLSDYELLKAFEGVDTHECEVTVPIFPNDQDIPRLASRIEPLLQVPDRQCHGYLIAGHGFYTWGKSIEDVMRHVEAFEFLFECEIKKLSLTQGEVRR